MSHVERFLNKTLVNEHDHIINSKHKIISDDQRQIIQVVIYVFLCGLISLFGTVANVINLVVFHKQGLNSSINISFFAMAVSDLCSLLMQQWFNVCVNPLFLNSDAPMMPSEFQYMTGGVPREVFAKITCLITVYVTAERCLCIAFPLHVKQMVTPRKTVVVIIIIYSVALLSVTPLYCTTSIDWKFYPERNETLLGLVFSSNSQVLEEVVYVLQAMTGSCSFVAVVVLTTILIRKLRQKSTWRKTVNADQGKAESMSTRDSKTMRMIVLIASIFILCYTPSVLIFVGTFFEPEFSIVGLYTNMFFVTWSFGFLCESINSSVNIFLYYNMSSKYRLTFRGLFDACRKLDDNNDDKHARKTDRSLEIVRK